MSEDLTTMVAKLEQKLANREFLIERMLTFLRNQDDAKEFLDSIEKHRATLQEIEAGP